ncbi:alpha/beta fold hydrolase [Vallicoccus soli]|uniref:Alpha/beta hydrolase n=1 Tax=Vallicoccus soli TaxID=2339232 RepID=A0A3A3Z5T1_9ACTN|nr:alpha/beta hydrolase [Vallicoccus soli]RJK98333.1 alpha/beta hydrolase [Vallicoccus soli]
MVSANGARFHVAEVGEGPLVLLLHGFPECWWAWRHLLEPLAAAGWRAAAVDLRGYGASDKPPRGYDPPTLVGDVAGVVRALGVERAVVVGHGWGGLLAWTAAVAHPQVVSRVCVVSAAHPRRLRTALLTDPAQMAASRGALRFQLPVLPERHLAAEGTVAGLLRAWSGPGAFPDREAEDYYAAALRIPGAAHCALETFRWAVRSVARSDGLRYAHAMRRPVELPVLQVHGSLDPSVLPTTAAGSGAHVRGPYRWAQLPGTGHFPHEEDPGAFGEVLLDWLARPG